MWERYKRMFWATQLTILVLVAVIFKSSGGQWTPTLSFFVMMQGFALIGASWSARLKRMIETQNGKRLPLQGRS